MMWDGLNRPMGRRSRWAVIFGCVLSLATVWPARAQPEAQTETTSSIQPDATPSNTDSVQNPDDGRPSSEHAPQPEPPSLDELRERLHHLQQLLEGRLSDQIEPRWLFSFDPRDESALVKARRELVRSVAGCASCEPASTPEPESEEGEPAANLPQNGNAAFGMGGAAALAVARDRRTLEEEIGLARLAFMSLPQSRRQQLLEEHAERRATLLTREGELSDPEGRAASAELARKKALEAARLARTEAERLLQEELARLLSVEQRQAEFESALVMKRRSTKAHAEKALKLQRRVREALDSGKVAPARAEALYRELVSRLKAVRDELHALLATSAPDPPRPGEEDPLAGLTVDIDTSPIEARRQRLNAAADKLERLQQQVIAQARAQLFGEALALNEDRLRLLGHLPSEFRSAVTGFGLEGFKHAAIELSLVGLTLRYHLTLAIDWLGNASQGKVGTGPSAFATGATTLQALLLLGLFFWLRKQLPRALELGRLRLREESLTQAPTVSPAERALRIAERAQRPVLLFFLIWAVHGVLPPEGRAQLEIQLLFTTLLWLVGASAAIQVIDAVAATSHHRFKDRDSALRLRSLRLVGRTVAAIGLVLELSQHLVGEGTIYSWVTTFTWTLILPFFLLLSYWWRPIVFGRLEAQRRKRPFQAWVLNHRTGLVGLLGAGLAGLQQLALGAFRAFRSRADELVLTRRLLAYLFKRQLDKKAETDDRKTALPLDPVTLAALQPQPQEAPLLTTRARNDLDRLIDSFGSSPRGLYAVVGERGAGKSTALSHVASRLEGTLQVRVSSPELEPLRASLAKSASGPSTQSLPEVALALERDDSIHCVVIDGAERLVEPVIRGLAGFDQLLRAIRPATTRVVWVLAFDQVIWSFFEGARGAAPTFDQVLHLAPWSEAEIRQLLETRTRAAGITPNFERLMPELPADADEVEQAEAHEAAATSFYRLIWDYSDGNPSVALHTWQRSLVRSHDDQIMVQLFQAPRVSELDDLPDAVAFVLRAIVQLGIASEVQIANVTKLNQGQVLDALRFCLARGYLESRGGGVSVGWTWFRPVTVYLERRHLLRSPAGRGLA